MTSKRLNMARRNPYFLVLFLLVLTGCASASYKSRKEGFTNCGYEEKKISEKKFSIDYYGAKSDSYDMLEKFWHQRATEVCHSNNNQADISRETYKGKTSILLPPFFYYDESGWPLLKGGLICNES